MTSSSPVGTLLVVDVQQAFDSPRWGARNNPGAEAAIARLIDVWRAAGERLVHVRHRNVAPDGLFHRSAAGFAAKPEAAELPGETVVEKIVNSAFIGTDLDQILGADGELVVVGLTTDHCVSTTVRMAANLGYDTVVVEDATATFERTGPDGRHWSAEEMHDSALASLSGEFASVVTSRELIARMSADQPT